MISGKGNDIKIPAVTLWGCSSQGLIVHLMDPNYTVPTLDTCICIDRYDDRNKNENSDDNNNNKQ